MSETENIKKALLSKNKKEVFESTDLLSTGSTLLNLAMTGHADGGFIKGKYFFFAGDSSSGKTFLALSSLAEASINSNFDEYRLIHDDVEGGALMDLERFFGARVVERLEPPSGSVEAPVYSTYVEDFYTNIDNAFEDGQPFIYILDSQDALSSLYAEKKFQELKKSVENRTESKGDYGDGKAKIHSARLRKVCAKLRDTGSILIIINQTRDNVGGGLFDPRTIYSGGRALKFYSCIQIWSSTKGKLKKNVKGKERQIGITSRVDVKKNRLSGKEWAVDIPIYYSYGVDDVGSCVDYLISEGHWKKTGQKVKAVEFEMEGTKTSIIKEIEEEEGGQNKLREIVQKVWKDVEEGCSLKRKPRYS